MEIIDSTRFQAARLVRFCFDADSSRKYSWANSHNKIAKVQKQYEDDSILISFWKLGKYEAADEKNTIIPNEQ